jgi:uncharacterized RmlC-like cupin family protein
MPNPHSQRFCVISTFVQDKSHLTSEKYACIYSANDSISEWYGDKFVHIAVKRNLDVMGGQTW